MCLNLAPFSRQPEKLGAALGISQVHLGEILAILTRIGYIQREGAGYKVMSHDNHLPKDNPLCGPHLSLMRLKSIDQLQRLSTDQTYSHSVTFTANDESRD